MSQSCLLATTANLSATYVNNSGYNATLTMNSVGAMTFDGGSPVVDSYILVKNQTSTFQNGIYFVSVLGDGSTQGVLTRYPNYGSPSLINAYGLITVVSGSTQANSGWLLNVIVTTVGTDPITFIQSIDQGGSTSINTVGTVTTGTWQANVSQETFNQSSGSNVINVQTNLADALHITDGATLNPYLTIDSTSVRQRFLIGTETYIDGPLTMNASPINFPGGIYHTGTASQTGTTVTGSGTTFPASCVHGYIYWPSSGSLALITARNSATSLTVDTSQSVSNSSYAIYYAGLNIGYAGISLLQGQFIESTKLDTPSSLFGSTTLTLGGTNATGVTITPALTLSSTVNKLTLTAPATAATLTLANNSSLITSGAFSTTLTSTATTSLTLPTSGTVISSAPTQSNIIVRGYDSDAGTITASQSGTTVTITSTTVSPNIVGTTLVFANGSQCLVTGWTDSTHVTVSTNTTNGSQSAEIYIANCMIGAGNASSNIDVGYINCAGTILGRLGTGRGFGDPDVSFGVIPYSDNSGTISQSGTTVTLSGSTFSSSADLTGGWFIPASGSACRIVSRDSTTQLTVSASQSIAGGTNYAVYFCPSNNSSFDTWTPSTLRIGTLNASDIYLGSSNTGSIHFTGSLVLGTVLGLAYGGTNANLTASNGGIFYSTASAGAILAGTATAGQLLLSGASAAPTWSTTTYPATNAINTLLYASSANVMSALATANNGTLITSAGGVPSISSTLPSAVQGNITSTGTIASGTWQGTVVGATYGGTGVNNGSSTITLGGSLTLSGAFTTTLTVTATTSVTLPTSGTLATTQGLPMTVVSGTSQSAAVNNSYISNNAGLCTVTLPSSAAVGDTVQIGGLGAGGWKVGQNASQLIHLGSSVTTTGTGGSLASSNQYDSIGEIRCVVANTTWVCFGVQGNITVV